MHRRSCFTVAGAAQILALALFAAVFSLSSTAFAQGLPTKRKAIKIGFLQQESRDLSHPASRLDFAPPNLGLAGAQAAMKEDNAAGMFTGYAYSIVDQKIAPGANPTAALQKLLAQNIHYIIVDAPKKVLLKVADAAKGKQVLLFNISANDNSLRGVDCRRDMLSVAPSNAMLADALGEYLVMRKWTNWLLVTGPTAADQDYANSIKRAAKRYGAVIVAERAYKAPPEDDRSQIGALPGAESSDMGSAVAATKEDVIIVADKEQKWGPYAPYRGADGEPRPVAGTSGLVPMSWSPAHAIWGARLLNVHFEDAYHRYMTPVDYAAYVAARTVGVAITRTPGGQFNKVNAFIRSPRFELDAFKGIRHTFRPWDGQFRDRILLVANHRVVVSVAPEPKFAKPGVDIMDTIGIGKAESQCKM